jgi:pimeloyl-ACP methyl ester carboxylesterase
VRFAVRGHDIDYETRGDGRPVVLVHGLTLDRRLLIEACEPVFAAIPGWRRLYLDLPGHGASRGDPTYASADDLVQTLVDLVREVAGPDAALVGHSYGGYLAQGVLRDVPTLRGLFLACPITEPDHGRRALPPQRVAVTERELEFGDDQERETFHGEVVAQTRAMRDVFHRLVHPAHVATDRAFLAAVRTRYAMSRLVTSGLTGFAGPVTIVCGRDDHWAGYEDAVRLVRAFPRCRYAVLPDCGNLAPAESPVAFAGLFADWLGRMA